MLSGGLERYTDAIGLYYQCPAMGSGQERISLTAVKLRPTNARVGAAG
jgi:hypothetical protein